MRVGLVVVGLLMSSAAMAQGPLRPEERRPLQADAERYLLPCKTADAELCDRVRRLMLEAYPEAVFGHVPQMRQVSRMLAEAPSPPIKRDLVEACAWAMVAAATARDDSADGMTVPQAERDLISKHCVRHGARHQNASIVRLADLLKEMVARGEAILRARRVEPTK